MNRAARRKMDRKLNSKLTQEQFQELKSKAVNELIETRVKKEVDEIWMKMSKVLIQVMRDNRISEERVAKIVSEFSEKIHEAYGSGKDEEISESAGA